MFMNSNEDLLFFDMIFKSLNILVFSSIIKCTRMLFMLSIFSLCNLPISSGQNNSQVEIVKKERQEWMLEAKKIWGEKRSSLNYNNRSEEIDLIHHDIELDMSAFKKKYINASCEILFQLKKLNVDTLVFDLLKMQVDSVSLNDSIKSFIYDGHQIKISLGSLNLEKIQKVKIFYQGYPPEDKSWGGFYFTDEYAYNIGVGFDADPHNFGRCWFPCFDSFQERSTYSFTVHTPFGFHAKCNGKLIYERINSDRITSRWDLKTSIPSYLASISVGQYITVKDTFVGLQDSFPIEIHTLSIDSSRTIQSFEHLKSGLRSFEYWFGPYSWQKVGYSIVPFHSGAMEHATNIAYPSYAVDGTLRSELLLIHELAHSWWGNLVTCKVAEQMWLNEGLASYAEQLFIEYQYGRKAYLKTNRKNHIQVLQKAHLRDGGYMPVIEAPHEYTYSMHVYDKGASVVHNLRTYLGDSLFRKALTALTLNHKFEAIDIHTFQEAIENETAVDLQAFFEDWIFRGGYPHFSIEWDSIYKNGDHYSYDFRLKQQVLGRIPSFNNLPLSISFFDDNWQIKTYTFDYRKEKSIYTLNLNVQPQFIILNYDHDIVQARMDLSKDDLGTDQQNDLQFFDFEILNDTILDQSNIFFLSKHLVPPQMNKNEIQFESILESYWSIFMDQTDSATVWVAIKPTKLKQIMDTIDSKNIFLVFRRHSTEPWRIHPFHKLNKDNSIEFILENGEYAVARGVDAFKNVFRYTRINDVYSFDQIDQGILLDMKDQSISSVELMSNSFQKSFKMEKTERAASNYWLFPEHVASGVYYLIFKGKNGAILSIQKISI